MSVLRNTRSNAVCCSAHEDFKGAWGYPLNGILGMGYIKKTIAIVGQNNVSAKVSAA